LRPYHRWGWWSVLVLLAAAAALTVWHAARQPPSTTTPASPTAVHAADSGPAAGHDVTITGAYGPTAGQDAQAVIGGAGPTAGGDVHITTITATGPVSTPAVAAGPVAAAGPISNLPPRNLAFTGRDELLDRLHQQLTTPTAAAAAAVTALADEDATPGGHYQRRDQPGGGARAAGAARAGRGQQDPARRRVRLPVRQRLPHPLVDLGRAARRHPVVLARQLGIPEQAEQAPRPSKPGGTRCEAATAGC
jgi:hypothetical protein